jgi:hypothetical protein
MPSRSLTLFEDLPPSADCAIAHDFVKLITTWPGENFERMTWTCTRCGEIRGRA